MCPSTSAARAAAGGAVCTSTVLVDSGASGTPDGGTVTPIVSDADTEASVAADTAVRISNIPSTYLCATAGDDTTTGATVTAFADGGPSIQDFNRYAVGVAAVDTLGNVGLISSLACVTPEAPRTRPAVPTASFRGIELLDLDASELPRALDDPRDASIEPDRLLLDLSKHLRGEREALLVGARRRTFRPVHVEHPGSGMPRAAIGSDEPRGNPYEPTRKSHEPMARPASSGRELDLPDPLRGRLGRNDATS